LFLSFIFSVKVSRGAFGFGLVLLIFDFLLGDSQFFLLCFGIEKCFSLIFSGILSAVPLVSAGLSKGWGYPAALLTA